MYSACKITQKKANRQYFVSLSWTSRVDLSLIKRITGALFNKYLLSSYNVDTLFQYGLVSLEPSPLKVVDSPAVYGPFSVFNS